VTALRGGLGAVYVKSAGNGFSISPDYAASGCVSSLSCQNASMDPENAEPWNIVVGAMNAAGVRSSYSTAGSALWISAPGGEYGLSNLTVSCGGAPCTGVLIEPAMVTTDQSGCSSGYAVNFFDVTNHDTLNPFNLGQTPNNANCNYTSTFNGTSSAAPVTSGVVALLLQANPSLTWRDVKHILAKTSTKVDPSIAAVSLTLSDGTYVAEPAWTTNAAGYPFHNWYGFGRVNVTAALAMAKGGYSTLPALSNGTTGYFFSCTGCSGAIPDNSVTGVTGTFSVSGAPSFVEAVQLTISLTHTYLGDVGIELTSPGGTRSVLLPPNNGYGAYPAGFSSTVLLSNAFYGEGSTGTWTVKVVDGMALDTGTLSSASLKIFGH
jgi:subtilisin-like proprotein convertase family protein